MKILLLFSIVTLFITGLSNAQVVVSTTPETTSVTDITTTEATTSTETPATTVEPTTTATPPITTSTAAAPTTTSTTATPTTATPTTKEPVTTLTPIITTKVPEPEECTWNITQKDVTCIRADFKMSFIVPIDGKNHQINLDCNAKSARSDCSSNETQTLVLSEDNYYNLTMVFEKEESKFSVKDIVFEYSLPAGKGIVYNNSTKIFTVKTGNSYLCKSESSVHLGNVTMQISEIHVQAFLQKDKNFGSAEECDADDKVSDVVPIAVGVALAALIIIVLIAYLVGRRRSRQKGYQSV